MIELTPQEAALVADLMKIANYPLAQVEVVAGLKAKLANNPQFVEPKAEAGNPANTAV